MFDKKANFASFRTYAWASGTPAFNPAAHKMILEPNIEKFGATITTVTARLFETYPKPPA